jgi:hypothetical protein
MPEITINQYTTIQLQEYKDTFSLVEGYINREGVFKPQFCKRSFGKDKPEKPAPLSIKCGNKEGLKALAHFILEYLGEQEEEEPFTHDEDLPF